MQDISLSEVVTEKRGRGRPRKADALTNAQRQAAFRARQKVAGKSVTVTKNTPAVVDGYDELVLENDRLREELAQVRRELAEQRHAFREPVGKKWSYRQISALAEREIRHHVAVAGEKGRGSNDWLLRMGYADGVLLFWYALTVGWQNDGDHDRLDALRRLDVTHNEK